MVTIDPINEKTDLEAIRDSPSAESTPGPEATQDNKDEWEVLSDSTESTEDGEFHPAPPSFDHHPHFGHGHRYGPSNGHPGRGFGRGGPRGRGHRAPPHHPYGRHGNHRQGSPPSDGEGMPPAGPEQDFPGMPFEGMGRHGHRGPPGHDLGHGHGRRGFMGPPPPGPPPHDGPFLQMVSRHGPMGGPHRRHHCGPPGMMAGCPPPPPFEGGLPPPPPPVPPGFHRGHGYGHQGTPTHRGEHQGRHFRGFHGGAPIPPPPPPGPEIDLAALDLEDSPAGFGRHRGQRGHHGHRGHHFHGHGPWTQETAIPA